MPAPTEVSPRGSPSAMYTLPNVATHDLQRGSPAPKFEIERPRRRSPSPVPASLTPSSSKSMYAPPPLTWRNAAQDAMAGIYYTKDAFPSSSFLPPPFSRERVAVDAGDRVELLEEIDEYAVRVRVLRTGAVGLIPAWNTEGALERLTRMNTAFNEAATCPVEARALRRRDSGSSSGSAASWDDAASAPADGCSLTHVHSRCIPFATRVRFPDYYGAPSAYSDDDDGSDESDASDADTPAGSPREYERGRPLRQSSQPAVFEALPRTLEKGGISASVGTAARSRSGGRKSVNFAGGERPQVVFRYPSEEAVGSLLGEETEAEPERGHGEEGEEEWWWQGWEEAREESAGEKGGEGEGKDAEASDETAAAEQGTVDFDEVFPFAFDEAGL
ncbi:hypothetical protein BD309DRAFT_874894 [Dichomitus squalens]|uniref:Uncharacterized protein n=1 Tax=Dichomitus squalens TaxID=114155 RepID=A0A4Q9PQE8_9APHY|nr:hypothetical protein BD309DRAFT_874894 [Dichomitus squalens]TBU56546.1 hypothetical protein BD310DRAFT_978741 [Dichomitus squalens]